ncbi:MAG: Zn(2+)-responsive transcriptional regulator [Gammaproteobacteria bacterium]|nr:Zn(2+)-responsive transcriptional regulator [Gammaproteobacteria bacterium]
MLKISEIAKKTGLSTHTLRFYEKQGLINASQRSEAGYRLYGEADVRKAEFIRTARNIGFSLDDIAVLLSIRLDKASHTCQEVTDIARGKLDEVYEKITELTAMKATLEILLASCCGGPEDATHCSIMEALDASEAKQQSSSGNTATNEV